MGIGELSQKSYVPSGLAKSEYSNIRSAEAKKRQANYDRNVKKAGIFQDYTDFYLKRGTDVNQDWKTKNKATLGHTMAKTKYDWSGQKGKNFGTTTAAVKKTAAPKKNKFTFGKRK